MVILGFGVKCEEESVMVEKQSFSRLTMLIWRAFFKSWFKNIYFEIIISGKLGTTFSNSK